MSENRKTFIPGFFKKKEATFIPEWAGLGRTPVLTPIERSNVVSEPISSVDETDPIIIKGGHCIIPYQGIFPLDIRIENGKIISLGSNLKEDKAQLISAQGKYIIPGIIDPHVHLGIFHDFDSELETETGSAILSGVTTIGLYITFPSPSTPFLRFCIPS